MSRIVILLIFFLSVTRLNAQTRLSSEDIKGMRSSVVQGKVVADYSMLYYEEIGRGEPVVLIHDHALNLEMWEPQFYALSSSFRMIRYDLRGYGESTSQLELIHFTHAEDLVTLLNALSIDKAHLVGVGMGGSVAADMLAFYPERVKSAVMVSGNLEKIPGPSQFLTGDEAARRDRRIAKLKEADRDKFRQKRLNELLKTAGTKRADIEPAVTRMVMAWDVWQPFHKASNVLGGLETVERLKETQPDLPVLIVEGNRSGKPATRPPEILQYLPGARFKVLNDCGRLVNMEQPEAFNQLVLESILPAAATKKNMSGFTK